MSSSEREQLASCPFCGSAPWGLFGPHAATGSFWVECHGPTPNTSSCGDWHASSDITDKEQAIAAWNRRAQASAEPEWWRKVWLDGSGRPEFWSAEEARDSLPRWRAQPDLIALQPLYASPQHAPLPSSYTGSQLLTSGSAVRVTFAFSDIAQAEAWHEKITASFDAQHGITAAKESNDGK